MAAPRSPFHCYLPWYRVFDIVPRESLAAATGGLSAFVWTGSLKGNVVLVLWWFIIPAITWPVDVSWALYDRLLS